MINSELGDDVYQDDPTVKELEKYCAEVIGKEASLFIPSGTFGNQLAILTHTNRGDEILASNDSHTILYETGGAAYISGVLTKTLQHNWGLLDTKEIEKFIRKDDKDLHYPK